MTTRDVAADNSMWLKSFIKRHGRPPRVLHIGNIANNAYLNAKILNAAGLDCDVLCYDYYHIMACPEWEDANFDGTVADQFAPDWTQINLRGFKRPQWFAQGPLDLCLDYLMARRHRRRILKQPIWRTYLDYLIGKFRKDSNLAQAYWRELAVANKTLSEAKIDYNRSEPVVKPVVTAPRSLLSKVAGYIHFLAEDRDPLLRLKTRLDSLNRHHFPFGHFAATIIIIGALLVSVGFKLIFLPHYIFRQRIINRAKDVAASTTNRWQAVFTQSFPDRIDSLKAEDINGYFDSLPKIQKLLQQYDLIQGYSTDGIFALLVGAPYVAYEHGTIRSIPFEQTAQGRLCALTYKQADYVCITNADNVVAAKTLGLSKFAFVPHPINEEPLFAPTSHLLADKLHADLDSDFLVFHPSRQHWDTERHPSWEKGNDIFIHGFARFTKEINPRARAIFVDWGNSVEKSKGLIRELEISDNIVWIQPQNSHGMAKYIWATDLLADQFYLGAFGSTLPRALACGRPAMLYLKTDLHEWCFEEMPPVINVCNSGEALVGLTTAYRDKEWAKTLATKASEWYLRYHSNQVIRDKLLTIYQNVLAEVGSRPA